MLSLHRELSIDFDADDPRNRRDAVTLAKLLRAVSGALPLVTVRAPSFDYSSKFSSI